MRSTLQTGCLELLGPERLPGQQKEAIKNISLTLFASLFFNLLMKNNITKILSKIVDIY